MSNRRNNILFYIQSASYSCVNLMVVGAIYQTFMLECGISEANVSLAVSVIQVVQTLTMLLLSKFAENIKNVLKGVAVCMFVQLVPMLAMLFVCLKSGLSVNFKYILLFGAGLVLALFMGLYSILAYKKPYHIMDIKDYGKITGQSGVIAGILGVAITTALSFALKYYSYFSTMTVVSVVGVVLAFLSGLVCFAYIPREVKANDKSVEKINIFRYKPFYQLLIPNLLRGISNGIFNQVTVIGYYCNILDAATAALLVTLSQIAMLVSCQSFAFIAAKRKSGILCLISSIAMFVLLPLMTMGGSAKIFVIIYIAGFFFNNYISYGVPVIVAENIDYNCLGQYTAWRMALFTGGVAIGGVLVPILLGIVGGVGTLLVSGITMLPCGIGYYLFDRQCKKNHK